MKKTFLLSGILLSWACSFGQNVEMEVTGLVYAGVKLPVPAGCYAESEKELRACDGVYVQWYNYPSYKELEKSFAKIVPPLEKGRVRSEISLFSFGSELKGCRLRDTTFDRRSYLFELYGVVNSQPLFLVIRSDRDFREDADLSDFLRKIITFQKPPKARKKTGKTKHRSS